MDSTHVDECELISVLASIQGEIKSISKFITGVVIDDETDRFEVGKAIMTPELEWYSNNIFITNEVAIYESSTVPNITEISCTEFLLMKLNSLGLKTILKIRECDGKGNLLSILSNSPKIKIKNKLTIPLKNG
ncbi:MAG: hypothetical protein ACI9YE_000283 [Psychroserpens sp.]|jgi:hypothetical protein